MAAGGLKWDVAAVITVVGWFVMPIITLLLAKILAFIGLDDNYVLHKLLDLEIRIIPELQQTLDAVDQKRMVNRGEVSHVLTLDKMAARLRSAQYEVDDILDDEQEIKLYRRSRCWHWIHRALATCIARFKSSCVWIARVIQRRSARPLQWARKISSHWLEHVLQVTASAIASCIAGFNISCMWIGRTVLSGSACLLQWVWKIFLRRQKYVLPVTTNGAASHESTSTTNCIVATIGIALVATDGAASSPPTIADVGSQGPVPMANDGDTSHESTRVVASVAMAPVTTYRAASSPTTISDVASHETVPLADDDAASRESACVVASVGMAPVAIDGAASSPPTISDVASDEPVSLANNGAASHESANAVASLGIAPVATDGAASSPRTIGDVVSHEPVPLANDGAASHESACVVASLGIALAATHDAASSPMTIVDLASDGPVLMQTDDPASRESAPTTTGDVASVGMALVATDVAALSPTTIGDVSLDGPVPLATDASASMTSPTNSMGHWLSCWWSSLDFFKNCCRSIFYWLVHVIEIASFYRDWSYDIIHITSKKENDTALDFVLTAISRWKLKKRIENVENTVNDLKNSPLLDVSSNNAPNDNANKNRSRIRTASTRKVFGRTVLLDDIMAKLRETPKISGTDSCYSVIGIYGVPGSGKTTFARYTRDYIEQECKEDKLFDTIMCIHLSKTFSVDDVFHEMLKDITNNQHSEISDREELEEKLRESLSGKRFFLILDDLWVTNKNDPQLEELKSTLNVGMKGSKILVTARTKLAAGALCADELIEMPDFPNEEDFSRVGRVIAEKLHQSPIAAVAVAGRLGADLDIKFWKNTANLGILNNTVNALWWSYQLLNPDIRRCLEMCNIFSRRAKLQRVKLVHMWIAQGFLKPSCETEDMEDVAECYIQELVSCSFLQPEGTCSVSATECFRIHDLLHDIIEKVAGSHCLRIENESSLIGDGWKGCNPQDVHHLLVENYDVELITEMILGMGNLRTLLIYDDRKDILVEEKFIENLCTRLPKLRVFTVAYTGGRTGEPHKFFFPESISMLKHLRDFAFWIESPCTVVFPAALTKLHHLRLLNLGASEKVEFTSHDLLNLQHIIWNCMNFPNVGKLTSLRTMPCFIVRNEQGYEVKQLRDLNKLRGILQISGLENVKSKEEALEVNLAAKERLATLVLEWDGDNTMCSPEVQAEVLEGLCPPEDLETLVISGYKGSRCPDWMVGKENGGPKNLQGLELSGWRQLGPGPEFEAFTHLLVLLLLNFSWDTLPANLEHLITLKELRVLCCLNVQCLPTLPQSIVKFHLRSCNGELIKSCVTVGHSNWQKIEHVAEKILEHCKHSRETMEDD